jgi:hypothetical protein
MSAIRCKVCERIIRGNAAAEEYDETLHVYRYTCRACDRLFSVAAPAAPHAPKVTTKLLDAGYPAPHYVARINVRRGLNVWCCGTGHASRAEARACGAVKLAQLIQHDMNPSAALRAAFANKHED